MHPASNPERLAQLMCQATRSLLWEPNLPGIHARQPNARLELRMGWGRATHHRCRPADGWHSITFGVQMIASKQNPAERLLWLSAREILRRGYGNTPTGSAPGMASLLSHTCCHEFAHLLQTLNQGRRRGEVHNAAFYHHLDALHHTGQAGRIREFLLQSAQQHQLILDDAPSPIPIATIPALPWRKGDIVAFGTARQPLVGCIVRINQRTCTIEGRQHCQGLGYRVPHALLRPMEPSDN